jgi:heparan-alpha-glucosaminide N-acetyltransferase
MSTLPKRLPSIDVFRSVTMFFMIFVNDLSGVKNIPEWIDHADARADAMGFADTIFPAFLFIVGLSIPLAINNKLSRGESNKSILKYILSRTFALLLMGFYHVNMENYDKHNWVPLSIFGIIVTLAFFLIWLDYSPKLSKPIKYSLITLGYVILIAMAFVYKGLPEEESTYTGMQPRWWGILGIIGWSYLIASLVYFYSKDKLKSLYWAIGFFVVMDIVLHTVVDDFKFPIITDGSSTALVLAGVIVSVLYNQYYEQISKRLYLPLIAGAVLIVAGLLIRPYAGGISKIYSTPAWIFICGGISLIVFTLLIYLVDQKGKQNWFKLIKPAGTSTLTCYLIPYLLFFGMLWADFDYPDSMNYGTGGILRSFGVSFAVILFVGLLERVRLRLKI